MVERSPSGRRAFLRGGGAAAVAALSGCLGGALGGSKLGYPGAAVTDAAPALEPHPDVANPVLTADDVADRSFARYVADPFVAVADGTYHLFFEVLYDADVSADIGHATSEDGLAWEYQGIVLNDPYHLAYPYVFQWDGEWYMTPDKATYRFNGIPEFRIYRGAPFPSTWELAERAVVNEHFGDPTPIPVDGTWYVWSIEQELVNGTRLHYADSLRDGAWTEHPASPVATAARNRRPAGRPVVTDDAVYLFVQDVARTYGDKVRCFEVTTLTEQAYGHREIDASPAIEATRREGWNGDGMHHVDAALAYGGETNAVLVDGKDRSGNWSIGLYRLAGGI